MMTSTSSIISVKDAVVIPSKSRSNFSSSFLFLSSEKRKAIRNVYAFFRVIDDLVDEEVNPVKQTEGIAMWKEALCESYQGKPQIPLLVELASTIKRFNLPQEYFLKLIEGCEMDITKKRYETFEELYEYCFRVAGVVGLVCMKIFEYEGPTADEAAIHLGLALQLTNIIRDVGVDLEKDRIYLPTEDLRRFGVSESDLFERKKTEGFLKLMEFQTRRAFDYYEKGFLEFSKDRQGKLLTARMMGTVYRKILVKIKKNEYPVLQKRVCLSFPEKCAILAKTLISHYRR